MSFNLERCTLNVPICICVVLLSGCFQERSLKSGSPLVKSGRPSRNSQPEQLNKETVVKNESTENKFIESKIAGEHVLVRDVRSSTEFIRKRSGNNRQRIHLDPDTFPKTSSRQEVFDIESLLKYRGSSSEKESIKDGEARIVWGATEMNYRNTDILLSALDIPFVIEVSGGSLGSGWGSGTLTVIVDPHNYREVAKVLIAAAKHGAIEEIHDDF